MSIDEAKDWLGRRYVLHSQYEPQSNHSVYALVRVELTWMRVRHRMRQERSFAGEVEQVRQRLRMMHGRVA